MRQDGGALETLAKLDRDRGGSPLAAVVEGLRLLLDQAAEVVEVEMRLVTRGGQHTSDGTGHRANPGATGRQLPSGVSELLQQVVAAWGLESGQLGKCLDGPARHPAGAMGAIVL